MPSSLRLPGAILSAVLALAGCATAPREPAPPAVDMPVAFKEGEGGWIPVAAVGALERGPWWALFGDPVLDELVGRVEVSNQTLAAAVAAHAQAQALVAEQRAALYPTVTATAGADRGGGGGATPSRARHDLGLGLAWELDLWGRLGQAVSAARASEQASAADLAAARLSLQGELAASYFSLRGRDQEREVLRRIVDGQTRTLQIARNRYEAGVVARTDVLQAQTQLANSRAELLALDRSRAQLEHAIAVLTGRAPGNFSLPDRTAAAVPDAAAAVPPPAVPAGLPSTLLLRRPDIVAAERRVALANAQLGIARSAWFPSLRLTGSGGLTAGSAADLLSASNLVWALGVSLAQSVFDGGARQARTESAGARLDEAAARYRQTVLAAFRDVEDRLVAARLLGQQQALREQAAEAAAQAEQQVMNRYLAGQVGFSEVVVAQTSAQNARRTLAQLQADRRVAAVDLIRALGGGWRAD